MISQRQSQLQVSTILKVQNKTDLEGPVLKLLWIMAHTLWCVQLLTEEIKGEATKAS